MSYNPVLPWVIAYSVVALAILLGNGLVIISFGTKRVLRTHTNFFIVSLAATDCFVGIISIPWWVVLLTVSRQHGTDWYIFLHDIWVIFDILGGVGSILHLVALSWDRLCAIVWPLRHRIYSTKRYLFALLLIWSLAIPVAVCSKPGMKSAPKAYNITVIVLFFFVPLCIICATQAFVIISLRKNKIQNSYRHKRSLRKEVRVAKTVIVMIVLFVIGWLPFFTLSLISYIRSQLFQPSMQAIFAVKFLQYSNSAVNPVLYAQKFPHFRKVFTALLCPCRKAGNKARNIGESFRTTFSTLNPDSIRKRSTKAYRNRNLLQPVVSQASSSSPESLDVGPQNVSEEIGLNGNSSSCSS